MHPLPAGLTVVVNTGPIEALVSSTSVRSDSDGGARMDSAELCACLLVVDCIGARGWSVMEIQSKARAGWSVMRG